MLMDSSPSKKKEKKKEEKNILMTPLGRVCNPFLQRALGMRHRLGRAAKLHLAADIIPGGDTQLTPLARLAHLERDTVTDLEG